MLVPKDSLQMARREFQNAILYDCFFEISQTKELYMCSNDGKLSRLVQSSELLSEQALKQVVQV